jgi:hypothetical protein
MLTYRIYLLNEDNKIYHFRVASCDTDADAIRVGGHLLTEAPAIEIWQAQRRVARLPAGKVTPLLGPDPAASPAPPQPSV